MQTPPKSDSSSNTWLLLLPLPVWCLLNIIFAVPDGPLEIVFFVTFIGEIIILMTLAFFEKSKQR